MIDALPEPSDPERWEEEIAARDSLAAGYIGTFPSPLSMVPRPPMAIAYPLLFAAGSDTVGPEHTFLF
jgi:hypothetical protein